MNTVIGSLGSLLFLAAMTLAARPAHAFDDDYKQQINGTTLHFRVRGADKANPYLVILHGGPGLSAHAFYPWGTLLEKTVNVVYLDQRGCGQSERLNLGSPPMGTEIDPKNYTMENLEKIVTHWLADGKTEDASNYTMATLVGDIESVRQFLKVDKWYVLGHSWGGMLGVEYVAAHSDHTLGYIHMDGLVSLPMTQNAILDNVEARFKAEAVSSDEGPKKEFAGNIVQTVKQIRAMPPSDPARFLRALGLAMGPGELYFARNAQTAWASLNGKTAEAVAPYGVPFPALMPAWEPMAALIKNDHYLTRDDTGLLAKIATPTLVVNGKQDGLTTPQMAHKTLIGIRNAKLVLLDDCGHFPFAEQPEKTGEAVLAFMNGKTPAPIAKGD